MNTINESFEQAISDLSNNIENPISQSNMYRNYEENFNDANSSEVNQIDKIGNVGEIENTQRFSSAIWFDEVNTKQVTVIGAGGIGSYCAFLLSRVNPSRIYIYDDDIVDPTNLGGQLYSIDDIGTEKINSINTFIRLYSQYEQSFGRCEKFSVNSNLSTKIMMCGLDNMYSRKACFEKWLEEVNCSICENKCEFLYIDGRLNAEEFQVFCITGDNTYLIEKYKNEWLFDDNEADETVCSYKQTSFTAAMIASIMVNLFVNFCSNKCGSQIERDLPFMTRYDAITMSLKTE